MLDGHEGLKEARQDAGAEEAFSCGSEEEPEAQFVENKRKTELKAFIAEVRSRTA